MSGDVECPYCGAEQEIRHDGGDGYTEDEMHQQECPSCEKSFVFMTAISFNYRVWRADCLNGGKHQMKSVRWQSDRWDVQRCTTCGHETRTPLAAKGE